MRFDPRLTPFEFRQPHFGPQHETLVGGSIGVHFAGRDRHVNDVRFQK